ncbi:MAG: hypothetical protein AB1633_02650 [Elusimicrobiota bacterium]
MKRFVPVIILVCLGGIFPLKADMGGGGASPEWGLLQKKISVRTGLFISTWDDKDERADVTLAQYGMRAATMVPVGDGTYSIKFFLQPGVDYNFEFFAVSTQPVAGITTGYVYYDPVPQSGSDFGFVISTDNINPVYSNLGTNKYQPSAGGNIPIAGYISIDGARRRYVYMPNWLGTGNTFYVYCNWASVPQPPSDFRARPGNGFVSLSWGAPYAYWGSDSEAYKAVDVLVGGVYHILRSTVSVSGPFEVVATTPGFCFSWVDTSVVNGRNYYYAIVSSDTYRGSAGLADVNLFSGTTIQPNSLIAFSKPGQSVPIRFRVENIDWEVVKKEKFLVWLTPENASDIYSMKYKIPARITMTYVKKTFREKLRD